MAKQKRENPPDPRDVGRYVRYYWDHLPISTIGLDRVVIVDIVNEQEMGSGHHVFEAWAVDREGQVCWAYASGCSCADNDHRSVEHDHEPTIKTFIVANVFPRQDWSLFDFESLRRDF